MRTSQRWSHLSPPNWRIRISFYFLAFSPLGGGRAAAMNWQGFSPEPGRWQSCCNELARFLTWAWEGLGGGRAAAMNWQDFSPEPGRWQSCCNELARFLTWAWEVAELLQQTNSFLNPGWCRGLRAATTNWDVFVASYQQDGCCRGAAKVNLIERVRFSHYSFIFGHPVSLLGPALGGSCYPRWWPCTSFEISQSQLGDIVNLVQFQSSTFPCLL
jgi:hypothetical protein